MIVHRIDIDEEMDILVARQMARETCKKMNFNMVDQTKIITAVSELSRNIYEHAVRGQVVIEEIDEAKRRGIQITFIDVGPGIEDVEIAMQKGYSTGKGMGLGLLGSKKLMDEFYIDSIVGKGTKIIIKKWL